MKEVKLKCNVAFTDQLDVRRPYLVFDKKTGTYHVLYWWANFDKTKRWAGSSWYEKPPTSVAANKPNWNISRNVRVWELPGVRYRKPQNITHGINAKLKYPFVEDA